MATSAITSSSATQLLQRNDANTIQKKNEQAQEAEQLKRNEAAKAAEKARTTTPPQQAIRGENQNQPPEPTLNGNGQLIGTRFHAIG